MCPGIQEDRRTQSASGHNHAKINAPRIIPRHVIMAFLACVLLLTALLSTTAIATALDGDHSSNVVAKRRSRVSPDATSFVADLRRPSVARRLSDGVARPPAASPPGDVKLALSQLAALVALTGWNATAELCSEWTETGGVTCNDRGMVTNIELQEPISAHTLTPPGRLPADIAAFTALQVLKLGSQNLSGPIPMDAFRNLTSLQELDLSSNPLNGTMEFLAYLPALQYLSLAFNYLTSGELPDSLSALTRLAHLYVQAIAACWGHLCFLLCLALSMLAASHQVGTRWPHPRALLAISSRLDGSHQPQLPVSCLLPTRPPCVPAARVMASGNGFSGSLPAAISALTALSELYQIVPYLATISALTALSELVLSHNDMEGPFSAPLASLPLMEEMQMSHNRFTWPIPASFSGLAALIVVNVSYNDLSGPIPPSFANLPAIGDVDISHNPLSGAGLDVLARMTQMSTLYIGSCNFSGEFPSSLARLPLYELDISNNSFTGPFPSAMLSAPRYSLLNLSANNFSGPLPPQLTTLTTVNSLDISHNQFTGVVPPAVFTLPSLMSLSLAHNQLEGSLPATNLSEYLISFDISNNNFSGPLPESMTRLIFLKSLGLGGNNLTGPISPVFGVLDNLYS
ncbi:unnamed protein product, partial [Closterium sp. Naga37s-1]